jgi:hypothetical protein
VDQESKWYALKENQVLGPFTDDGLKKEIAGESAEAQIHVWGPELKSWISSKDWLLQISSLQGDLQIQPKAHVWYCTTGSDRLGPLVMGEFLEYLRSLPTLNGVFIWRNGMPVWISIFDCDELLLPLGLNRRKMLRAPLMGRVIIRRSNDDLTTTTISAASISTGGIGVSGIKSEIRTGDTINFKVTSLQLSDTLRASGKVLYCSKSGYSGISFTGIDEWQQKIIETYVSRFAFLKKNQRNAA